MCSPPSARAAAAMVSRTAAGSGRSLTGRRSVCRTGMAWARRVAASVTAIAAGHRERGQQIRLVGVG